jgi:tight adherence protein B
MLNALGFCTLIAVVTVMVIRWRDVSLRHLALDRISEQFAPPETAALSSRTFATAGPLSRIWWWVPWVGGLGLFLLCYLAFFFPLAIAVAAGLIAGLLGGEVEVFFAQRKSAKMESQLAEGIDLMIGALGAGAGLSSALHAAIEESSQPLKGELEDVLARIRLGDDPQSVLRNFAIRVPLETYLLFCTTLAIHWEVGGSLAATLASVGRTIRDRLETSRRIASNIVQSQLSTLAVLIMTYFIAAIVWRNTPEQMAAFLGTSLGQWAVAATMLLQGVGIVWMSVTSRPRF